MGSCMFFVARVTSIKMAEGAGNMFGVSDAIQKMFDTGLLGALFLTVVGSISWQLVASAFPIAFMANPLTYILLRIALFIEFTGICNGAWVVAATIANLAGYQRDEVTSELQKNVLQGTWAMIKVGSMLERVISYQCLPMLIMHQSLLLNLWDLMRVLQSSSVSCLYTEVIWRSML